MKPMVRKVKTGRGNKAVERNIIVLVATIRIAEHAVIFANDLMNRKKWLPSEQRFGAPFRVHDSFHDKALIKFSSDAGNGSTKGIANFVNVENPQGQEHVGVVFEFSGAKDIYENIRAAAFEDGSIIKSDFESLMNRRWDLMQVKVQVSAAGDTRTQVVLAINTDPNHNHYFPQPLPTLSGPPTTEQAELEDENKIGIVSVDFSTVGAVKLLCTEDRKSVLGLSFFYFGGDCISSSHFREKIDAKYLSMATVPLRLFQHVTAGALSADLDFLSKFLGHMGASAKYPCCFCLALLEQMIKVWDADCPDFAVRTMESIMEDYENYHEMFESQPESKRIKSLRTRVTQRHSHSISNRPLGNIPADAILKALLHIRLGFTRTLLNMVFDFFVRVELLSSNTAQPQFRACIEMELKRLIAYESWLTKELEDYKEAVEGHDKFMDKQMDRLECIQKVLELDTLGPVSRARYENDVITIEKEIEEFQKQEHMPKPGDENDEETDYATQLIGTQAR